MKFLTIFQKNRHSTGENTDTAWFTRFREVLSVCGGMEFRTGKSRMYLASAYMKCVSQESTEWKRENADVLFENFFIYDYLAEKGLIERRDEQVLLLHPEGDGEIGMCEIKTRSSPDSPETGRVEVRPVYGSPPDKALWGMDFASDNGVYVLNVADSNAPLLDRAVEAGAALIDFNIGVCVYKKILYEKIFMRDFKKINRYRVFAPEDDREIAFSYPWNPALHKRLFLAGAKWNGKYMAMPLVKSENAQDVIVLYGFYVEPNAKKRMEMWSRAEKTARTMPRNRDVSKEDEALVRTFLTRPIKVIEDLSDE